MSAVSHASYAPLAGKQLKVLVADDVAGNQMVMQAILARAGCSVVVVDNGAAAIAECARETFDVVLMDMRMPGMSGLDAVRAIRSEEQATGRARVPILMCSAAPEHAAEAGEAGADGYVTKPITPRGLIAQIATTLT
ncbi:sensory box histidine kinase [alpha proteobacterium U9-1i]|nr:sensory box histidine kinase [alpha proteobacterium U9-1i]